jgi:DNA-binding transcriptional LysR family regulator
MGTTLFDRIDGRLSPTPPLSLVLTRLQTISDEATLSIAGLKRATAELQGQVRVTSVGFILSTILAPALGAFGREHSKITLDFIADNQALSFAQREADIAVRLGRTAEASTRIKKLGTIRFCLCRPLNVPETLAAVRPIVRYGEDLAHLPEMIALDQVRPMAPVALRSDRLDILHQAAIALGADVMLPKTLALQDGRFQLFDQPEAQAERPVYLMLHPDRASVPSVSLVAQWIEHTLRTWNNVRD